MKFDKIIFLNDTPMTKRYYGIFFMEEISRCGIEIEYWDITELLFSSTFRQEDSYFLVKTIKFKSYYELEKAIDQQYLKKVLFISIMNFQDRIKKIHILLRKYNLNLGFFARNQLPKSFSKYLMINKILRLRIKKIINLYHSYKLEYNLKKGLYKKYDFVFQGGKLGFQAFGNFHEVYKNSQILRINSSDYDDYLENNECERLINDDYILFLDEYVPFHPDYNYFSIGDKIIVPEEYFDRLNNYFDKLEKQFSLPVVIAAHPRALKYKECDHFMGRKIYFGMTCQLTKYATFVLAHSSTSISYAILFNKPIHLVTSKSIEQNMWVFHNEIMSRIQYIGCAYQYLEDKSDVVIGEINIEKYNRYKYDYLTSEETEKKLSCDIFVDFLIQD
jgi:hypothetical protein